MEYEIKAAKYLEKNGYKIIEKNFYSSHSEIDIVAIDKNYIVFIEVKYRKNNKKGSPLESVNYKKRNRIIKGAKYYLHKYYYNQDVEVRFDVVSIEGEDITIIKDAFWIE